MTSFATIPTKIAAATVPSLIPEIRLVNNTDMRAAVTTKVMSKPILVFGNGTLKTLHTASMTPSPARVEAFELTSKLTPVPTCSYEQNPFNAQNPLT